MGRFDFKTRTGQISGILQTPFDLNAQDFFNRVTAAGGTLTSTEQVAINDLVLNMKGFNIWNSMKAIYPMVGASAAACAQNLKSSSFTGSFSSGWTFASTGATPNGTSAFFNTTLNPTTSLSVASAHFSKYNRNNDLVGAKVDGAFSTINSALLQINYTGANAIIGDINTIASYVPTDTRGFFVASRTTTSLIKAFRNSTQIATNTNTTSVIANDNVNIGRRSDNSFYNSYECAFASLGDGLTDTQASNFYTAVQAFNTSLSRQV